MATLFERKLTFKDDTVTLLRAIRTISKDKHQRLILTDEIEWLQTKLRECGRLALVVERQLAEKKR